MQNLIILSDICAIVLMAGFLHPPKHFLGKPVDGNNGDLLMNLCGIMLGTTVLIGIFLPIWIALTASVWYVNYTIGFVLFTASGFYLYLKIAMEMAWRGALRYQAAHGLNNISRK
ncbi:MAG: hypothetical protein WCL18_10500 [bacterium]